MEISFSELRAKVVINLVDGRKLGHIIDLIFEQGSAKVLGVIVPGSRSMSSIFRPREDIFIPYHNICKIGMDTILVELNPLASQNVAEMKAPPPRYPPINQGPTITAAAQNYYEGDK